MYHLSPFKVRKRVGAVQWKDGRKAKGRKGHACEKASWTANNHDNKFLHACVRELERKCETKSLVEAPHKSEGRPSLLLFQIILHVTTFKSTVSPEANVTSSPKYHALSQAKYNVTNTDNSRKLKGNFHLGLHCNLVSTQMT